MSDNKIRFEDQVDAEAMAVEMMNLYESWAEEFGPTVVREGLRIFLDSIGFSLDD